MTPDLDRLRELMAAATPGPLRCYGVSANGFGGIDIWDVFDGPDDHVHRMTPADRLLYVAMRNALPALLDRLTAAEAEVDRVTRAGHTEGHEVEQALGRVLGYPWYKDDPKNFPDATEADGVCVGEHTPPSIADEAAARIKQLEAEVGRLRELLGEAAEDLQDWGAYAGEYFQDKHDLAGTVARYRKAALTPEAP